jgi:hypothetical protein
MRGDRRFADAPLLTRDDDNAHCYRSHRGRAGAAYVGSQLTDEPFKLLLGWQHLIFGLDLLLAGSRSGDPFEPAEHADDTEVDGQEAQTPLFMASLYELRVNS